MNINDINIYRISGYLFGPLEICGMNINDINFE